MSFGRHHVRYLLASAVAVAGLHVPQQLAAQGLFSKPPGRRIIESSSSSDRGTNSTVLDSNHTDLTQFEEELKNSSFAPFSYSAASGYAPMPVLRSATIPSKRTQEMLERRKNWMLLSPDETVSGPSAEDVFGVTAYGPDGERKKKTSPIEEFLFPGKSKESDKDESGSSRSRKERDRDPDAESDPDASEDANLPESIRESQRSLRTALGVDPSDVSGASARSSFSDFFGLAARRQTIEQESMQKARQDEWGSLFGVQQAPLRGLEPLKSVFNPPLSSSSPVLAPQLPDVIAPPKTEASLPALSGLQPFQGPSLVPDASYKAYAPVTPSLDSSKPAAPRLMPPAPTFTAPRRAF